MSSDATIKLNKLFSPIASLLYGDEVTELVLIYRTGSDRAHIHLNYANGERKQLQKKEFDLNWQNAFYHSLLDHFDICLDIIEQHSIFSLPCGGIVKFENASTDSITYPTFDNDQHSSSNDDADPIFLDGFIDDIRHLITFIKRPAFVCTEKQPVFSDDEHSIYFGQCIHRAHSDANNMWTNFSLTEPAPVQKAQHKKRIWNEEKSHHILDRIIHNQGNDLFWRIQNPEKIEQQACNAISDLMELISENLYWAFDEIVNKSITVPFKTSKLTESRRTALIKILTLFGKAPTDIKNATRVQNLLLELKDALQLARFGETNALTANPQLGATARKTFQKGQLFIIFHNLFFLKKMNIHLPPIKKAIQKVMWPNSLDKETPKKTFSRLLTDFRSDHPFLEGLILPKEKKRRPPKNDNDLILPITFPCDSQLFFFEEIFEQLNEKGLQETPSFSLKRAALAIEDIFNAAYKWHLVQVNTDPMKVNSEYQNAFLKKLQKSQN